MDTFYEENQENNIKMLKNKMTLDFNSPTSHSKKSKLMKTCILESPDLKMCKLGSPELERMIIQHNGMVTTTPTPSAGLSYLMKQEQEVTEEQEQYARGFVEALNQLHRTNGHNNNQTIPTTNGGQQHLHPHHQQQQHPHHPQQQHPNPQLMNNSQLNTINNHSNNNNLSNNQNTSHLNSNQNLMNSSNSNNNSHSSDSSQDLTIADTTAANNTGAARRNSYHMLVPPPPQQVVVTTASAPVVTSCYDSNNNQTMNGGMGANGGGVKFAVPHMPSHDQQSHQQPQQQQQYVQVSTGSMTSGAHVLINNSVNTTTANTTSASILPPYSQAVSSNSIYPMTVKVEPQSGQHKHAAPSTRTGMSPPLSGPLSPVQSSSLAPIDMADQERIKLERKRLRNRIAASKCRRRKLERISRLEDKVKGLKGENSELSIVVNKLRDQVCSLKQQVMGHIKCGCQLMMPQ